MNNNDLIQKWLSDELSEKERMDFEAMEDAPFFEGIIKDAASFKATNFTKVADFETFKKQSMQADTPVIKLPWYTTAMRVASVAVVLFGLYYIFLFNTLTEVETLVAQKTTIELPDSSRVILNALSEVSYNADKWNENREINLEGEAFFDVAKGAKFDVVTTKGTVSVLGTEFNVKQRGDYFEVACFEGTVRVVSGSDTKILKVGDKFTLLNGKVASSTHQFEAPQWTENRSYFQRIPVQEVFSEMERQYGITVIYENIDAQQLFTGTFVHDNLENALLGVIEPLELDYEILKNNTVRLSTREK